MGQVADYLRFSSRAINAIGLFYVFDAIDFNLIDQLELMAANNDQQAKVGKRLWDRGLRPIQLPEGDISTPNSQVPFQGQNFLVEVKALHVRRGVAKQCRDHSRAAIRLFERRTPSLIFLSFFRWRPRFPIGYDRSRPGARGF
jgi:hypothetical protein